ncbi:hypothetical protein Mpal_1937 [Methanosphaerula palustris E1-9c]|uniref:Uncharacterized protein n=1 Tax=Methanosphaerula palustris (strain ATCC BAA-1556 / DSM 19958 / E1-9c) TaxID=521011 RepID=B8GKU5_METPE|nr:hypothetical protein Mpal_1937 [Methanosphaerula palustris E1-9c]
MVSDVLIIFGMDNALRPFRQTTATFLGDTLEEYHNFLRFYQNMQKL